MIRGRVRGGHRERKEAFYLPATWDGGKVGHLGNERKRKRRKEGGCGKCVPHMLHCSYFLLTGWKTEPPSWLDLISCYF